MSYQSLYVTTVTSSLSHPGTRCWHTPGIYLFQSRPSAQTHLNGQPVCQGTFYRSQMGLSSVYGTNLGYQTPVLRLKIFKTRQCHLQWDLNNLLYAYTIGLVGGKGGMRWGKLITAVSNGLLVVSNRWDGGVRFLMKVFPVSE